MDRKPQQQTLSIRISETLREFLERYKNVLSTGRGESVSTSDAAKFLLESAKDDRSDFRLEVADLQREATASLSSIREKWEIGQPISRAEWVFLGQYIQIASEEISENPTVPAAPSFIDLLKALLAVRGLRADRGIGLDRYYLENLGVPVGAALNDRQLDPDLVPRTVAELTEELRRTPAGPKPAFAGRCFYVALRDEVIPDLRALNRALAPLMPAADGSLETVLHEIISRRGITYQCPCIAAQRRDQRFDREQHVIHGWLRPLRGGEKRATRDHGV